MNAVLEPSALPATAEVTAVEATPENDTATATATATATVPTVEATTSASHEPNLLRDWESGRQMATTPAAMATPAGTVTATEAATPPLAPSFLLSDRVSSRSYPVARSIATLVRGAVDHIADHLHDMQIAAQGTAEIPHSSGDSRQQQAPIECLSIRSEGGLPSSHQPNQQTHSSSMDSLPQASADSVTVRSVPAMNMNMNSIGESAEMMMEDQMADFVLIDGDLVRIPPAYHPNEQEREGLEEYQRDQEYLTQKSCQPKPVRKGVRGFRKFIKKRFVKHKDKDKAGNKASSSSERDYNKHSALQQITEDTEYTNSAIAAATTTTQSPNTSVCESSLAEPAPTIKKQSTSKKSPRSKSPLRWGKKHRDRTSSGDTQKKEEHKKKRLSWRRNDHKKHASSAPSLSSAAETTTEDLQPPSLTESQSALSLRETPSMASSAPPSIAAAASTASSVATAPMASYPPVASYPSVATMPQHVPPENYQHPMNNNNNNNNSMLDPNVPFLLQQQQQHQMMMQQQQMMQQQMMQQQMQHNHHPPAYAYDALSAHSPPPPMPDMSGPPSQQQSVHASYVGDLDQVMEAGVLMGAQCCAAEAYIENYSYFGDEKKDEPSFSVLPPDADYKVDKADAPDVEYMLQRAAQESEVDVLETSWGDSDESFDPLAAPSVATFASLASPGKTSGMSCPLSTAKATDEIVHNDVLKVVMVGAPSAHKASLARAIRQSNKKPKKRTTLGVDVHSWTPDMGPQQEPVKFSIWDVQGASREDGSANFGADPGIQSLFFSSNSLYILVWDLAADNMKTYGRDLLLSQLDQERDDSDDEEDEEEDNEFLFEEAKRQADLVLLADIEKRVLSWIDCIARRGPGSSILPVATIPETMDSNEAKRRCDMMQKMLEHHINRYQGDTTAPKLLIGMENIMCVSLASNGGIHELQEFLIAVAADESVFDHVGTQVSSGTVILLDTIRRLKQEHKLVRVDHLMSQLGRHVIPYNEVTCILHFLSSIGEILYFGNEHDELLSRYVILSRKWFVSALSCILRNDLKRELAETRRFMNMQCIYSDQQFPENHVIQALTGDSASSCPLLCSTDTNMLWQSMQFMREAADRSSQLSEYSTTVESMFGFLERLLVHSEVFLPLNLEVSTSMDDPEVYFVPCLMATATDNDDVWTFKSSEGWMTTLCHSWLFRDGAPSDLMEHITVGLVRDIYGFSRSFPGSEKTPPHRTQSFPLVRSGADDFLRSHESEQVGRIKIHQIMCWQSAFLVKIGCIFADPENGELKESFVEVFVTLVDMSSSHCVASDAMRATMQRLVVSGKGQAGSHGAKLWKGGFEVVMESIQNTLGSFSNIDRQVVCPECLAHSQPRFASTWSWDSVKAAAESGSSIVRCIRGHRVDSNLICGVVKRQETSVMHEPQLRTVKPVPELLQSVVLVGLWDADTREIRNVGSGFIADKRLGLVVTAGHVLFNMEEGSGFGAPYYGLKNAKVVIGVLENGVHNAVYRYFAEIMTDDIYCVDACVLRLTEKLTKDVDGEMSQQPEDAMESTPLNLEAIAAENLKSLKLTTRFELEESVRILGFNQGGEGRLEKGKHVNRSADFAKGYICKKFVAPHPMSEDDSSHSSETSSRSMCFVPREEIVVICPTIAGHSGGPCVNNDGKVVGVLSRADPGERQRCYLVPSSELKELTKKAKKHFTRPSMLTQQANFV